jgi:hypothetical protein
MSTIDNRLREILDKLASLDAVIQDFVNDSEYTADLSKSEEYIDAAKREIWKADRVIKNRIASTRGKVNPAEETYASKYKFWLKIYKETIILPVVLYGCETWSLTLRAEHRVRAFENSVLRGKYLV